jgi:hypothetical protein
MSENQLSAGERALFRDKMLNDIDTARVHAPILTGASSISVVFNNTIATCAGTNFLSTIGPGDTIWMPTYGVDENVYRVKQDNSDTELGAQPAGRHHFFRPLQTCAQMEPRRLRDRPSARMIGDPALYPMIGGGQSAFYHNLTLTSLWSEPARGGQPERSRYGAAPVSTRGHHRVAGVGNHTRQSE